MKKIVDNAKELLEICEENSITKNGNFAMRCGQSMTIGHGIIGPDVATCKICGLQIINMLSPHVNGGAILDLEYYDNKATWIVNAESKTPEQRAVAVVHDRDATLEHLGLLDDPTEWVENQLKMVDPDPFFFDDELEFREGGTFTREFADCEMPPVDETIERRFTTEDGGEVDYNLTAYIDVESVDFRYELIGGKKTLICRATWEW